MICPMSVPACHLGAGGNVQVTASPLLRDAYHHCLGFRNACHRLPLLGSEMKTKHNRPTETFHGEGMEEGKEGGRERGRNSTT